MTYRTRLLLAATLAAACGTEPPGPGALSVTLDPLPNVVATTSLTVAGTVTRTPVLAVPTFVRATTPAGTEETGVDANGRFSLAVTLPANAQSTITVTPWDSTASTATPASVAVRHDSRGPAVRSATPPKAAANVSLSQTMVVTFDEPVDPDHQATTLFSRGARPASFTAVLSPDSLTLTITPTGLVPGAVYYLLIGGYRDAVGNTQSATFTTCFMTAPPANAQVVTDPGDDVYYAGDVAGLTPTDFLDGTFSVNGSLLDVLLRFTTARIVATSGTGATFVALDLDYDRDASTGWRGFRDIVFNSVLQPSGMRGDHAIILAPVPQLADSSFVGRYLEELVLEPLATFVPVSCGTTIGFTLDLAATGLPPAFHMVGYFESANTVGVFADPAPDASYYQLDLGGAAAARVPAAAPAGSRYAPVRFPAVRRIKP